MCGGVGHPVSEASKAIAYRHARGARKVCRLGSLCPEACETVDREAVYEWLQFWFQNKVPSSQRSTPLQAPTPWPCQPSAGPIQFGVLA